MTTQKELDELRFLILKSQSEPLSEQELERLNTIAQTEAGAQETAKLVDQLCALKDSRSFNELTNPASLTVSGNRHAASPAMGDSRLAQLTERDRPALRAEHPSAVVPKPDAANPVWDFWAHKQWILALAASNILIASLVWSFANSSPRQVATLEEIEPASPQLISATACVWRAVDGLTPEIGERIGLGDVLSLVEGIAELSVGEGTPGESLVRIEAPANVFIRDDGQLGLQSGSLTVKSLGLGSGNVTVDTPVGLVSVDGQSFIGLVSQGAINEVHVFSGQAVVTPNAGVPAPTLLRLEGGEAVRFTSNSDGEYSVVMMEATLSSFISARSSGFDPLVLDDNYAQSVLESRPSIYWRFEELSGNPPYRIENQGSAPNLDAVILGDPGWRQYGENQVAELGKIGISSGFQSDGLWPPKPLDEYTIELWTKPELYHHGEMVCLHVPQPEPDGRYSHSVIFETLRRHWHGDLVNLPPNNFRFVHRTPASGVVTEGSNLVSGDPYQVRIWQHVVVQKRENRVSLWVDGRVRAVHHAELPLTPELQIVVGQLYLARIDRRFVGQLDELAFYDRCLSGEEIRAHIKAAGRPIGIAKPHLTTGKK